MAERVVGTFKKTMHSMSYSTKPVLTSLGWSRMLYAIADVINDRPLAVGRCRISSLNEDRLLRPNDLLLGRCSSDSVPLVEIDDESLGNVSARRQKFSALIRQKEALLREFWTKYQEVVFPTIVPRPKWFSSNHVPQVGDIVIVRDINPIRGQWTWGEITELKNSSDGKVRSATVRYKSQDGKQGTYSGFKSKSVVKSLRELVVLLRADERT
jgi:hypothetical protein